MIYSLALSILVVLPGSEEVRLAICKLHDPSQPVRDTSAAELRKTFAPTTRERWQPLLEAIPIGEKKGAIDRRLQPATAQMLIASGGSYIAEYRLDDCWVFRGAFSQSEDSLLSLELLESLTSIWVKPAEEFTGTWITYHVNGQKRYEIQYQNGKYHGIFMSFHSNGRRSVVQHYVNHVCHGEDTGYFPSGKVQYTARYDNDKPVGTWVWYHEDGTVQTTREHSEDKNLP